MPESDTLRQWVIDNLTSQDTSQLDRWKEDVAKLLSLSKAGDVLPKIAASGLDAKATILLQALGKTYAQTGGLVGEASISAAKLKGVIAIPTGTVGWALAELRKERLLLADEKGGYVLPPAMVGEAISRIKRSLETERR